MCGAFTAHWADRALSRRFCPLFLDAGQRCQGVTFKRLIGLWGIWVNKGGITYRLRVHTTQRDIPAAFL